MAATSPQTVKPAAKAPLLGKKPKTHYVYSTASNDTVYGGQKVAKAGEAATPTWRVLIKGGANVLNKRLQTARGVATKVTQDELDLLLEDAAFKRHMKAGYITHSPTNEEVDEVAADMKAKDGSAQKVAADFPKGQVPSTGPATAKQPE